MIPTIDPRVKYVGASHLRKLNSNQLRQLEGVMVVRDNSEPLAVIVPYEMYLRLQTAAKIVPDNGEVIVKPGFQNGSTPIDFTVTRDDLDEFDQRRQETRSRIAQGARRTPREKGDGKR